MYRWRLGRRISTHVALVIAAAWALWSCFPSLGELTGGGSDTGAPDGSVDARLGSDSAPGRPDASDAARDVVSSKDATEKPDSGCGDTQSDPENCGACGHDCQGSGCEGGLCEPTVLSIGENTPVATAMDTDNIYWLDLDYSPGNGTVRVCAKTGCSQNPTTLAMGQDYPAGMWVQGSNVYWTDANGGFVMGCALPGCATVSTLASGQDEPWGIVTDATGTTLYWANSGEDGDGDGTVMKCTLPACATPEAITTGLDYPYGLAVDSTRVYIAQGGVSAVDGLILSCPLAGCGSTPTVIQGGQLDPEYLTIDATNVYWTSEGAGTVLKCPLAGCAGDPTPIAMDQGDPTSIAVDATNIYWTNNVSAGSVMTCPIAGCVGGVPTTLAAVQSLPIGVLVDDTFVYWVDEGDTNGTGTVMKVAK
jgi:DNA-binding beta-propeller fold protein YncE